MGIGAGRGLKITVTLDDKALRAAAFCWAFWTVSLQVLRAQSFTETVICTNNAARSCAGRRVWARGSL